MSDPKFWHQALIRAKKFNHFRRLPGLLAIVLCIILISRWLPEQVGASEITPQLRQQVLQIIRENPEVILDSVRTYQQKQQDQQKKSRQSMLQQMQANPKATIGQSPIQGAKNGKILLVEFSDFQCPYCTKAHAMLKEFMAKHGDSVTLVYKHLPLTSIHPQALLAAKAAWAAGQQGKFWEFHNALFENQSQLGEDFYRATAKSLGLDMAKFDRDRASKAAATAINQDLELAEKLGIDGTPFFVMNGEAFAGAVELADLEEAVARVKKSS